MGPGLGAAARGEAQISQPKTSILPLLPGQRLPDSLPVPGGDGVTARLPRRPRSIAPRHRLRLQSSTLQPAALLWSARSAYCRPVPRRRPAAGGWSPLQQPAPGSLRPPPPPPSRHSPRRPDRVAGSALQIPEGEREGSGTSTTHRPCSAAGCSRAGKETMQQTERRHGLKKGN
ncbi:uncharacterized protein LOC110436003 [Sorghum bicolor]|uniref:uncharacterized protein LOC110436003 n=1 Tax=Sorghum bicolor TaxID=4558 RepID=UPI000B424887|nr:uncharacterized protein LOC110436003 [Sorghum bicolor]|eukprot:XP_021317815.1 uncharacterized protein LOC110436003 [Sorghum bicolor]